MNDEWIDSGVWYCIRHHGIGNEDDNECDFAEDADDVRSCTHVALYLKAADMSYPSVTDEQPHA